MSVANQTNRLFGVLNSILSGMRLWKKNSPSFSVCQFQLSGTAVFGVQWLKQLGTFFLNFQGPIDGIQYKWTKSINL